MNMQTLMNQRDRVQLTAYQRQLKGESQEWFYARNILRDSVRITLRKFVISQQQHFVAC